MNLIPLQITAWIYAPLIVSDDWSPKLENIVFWEILRDIAPQILRLNDDGLSVITNHLILAKELFEEFNPFQVSDEGLLCVSSPYYVYSAEDYTPNKGTFRDVSRIDWFAIADKRQLFGYLSDVRDFDLYGECSGRIARWEFKSLQSVDRKLIRPIPVQSAGTSSFANAEELVVRSYFANPLDKIQNKTQLCCMPSDNVTSLH